MEQYQTQRLIWSTCYDNFDCSTLKVPIDYTDLKLGTFNIGLLRYQTTEQSTRIGSLVVNPGGPGASGMEYASNAEYIVSPEILTKYDIVGFDPRGIGQSAPIRCLTNKETDASYAADSKPDNQKELQTLITQARTYIAKCEANTKNITHYSTADSARDMDLLRAALGDKKLNYLGKSYGTYLGTLYAQFFPDRVGRMIFDGAIDPNSSGPEQNITQAVGFDHALNAFIADCYTRSNCPLPKPESRAIDQIITTFHSAAIKPLTSKGKRPVTESLIVLGTASGLYDNISGWPQLRIAFKEALAGNGLTFLNLADQYSQRNNDGTYANNETDAAFVIDCLDWQDTRTIAQIEADATTFATAAPIFGPYLAYGALYCQYFPSTPTTTATPSTNHIESIATTPIIIIGTTRDPATPYEWAQGLHRIIQNSRLISLNADGHTGHGRGSVCVDSAVDKYLLTGALPTKDLACSL
ncbi:MAG: alpha/beta hydrolase [Actinomycetota bacterium]